MEKFTKFTMLSLTVSPQIVLTAGQFAFKLAPQVAGHITKREFYQKMLLKQSFSLADKKIRILSEDTVSKLADSYSILGILQQFKNNQEIPSVNLLAIRIAFELRNTQLKNKAEAQNINYSHLIRELANTVYGTLLEKLFEQELFTNVVSESERSYDPEIDLILSNRFRLSKAFFESYSNSKGPYKIIIHLQNEEKPWVTYEEKDSIIVSVDNYLSYKYGLFQQGYDYQIIYQDKTTAWLKAAYLDRETSSEIAVFSGDNRTSISEATKKWDRLVWLN